MGAGAGGLRDSAAEREKRWNAAKERAEKLAESTPRTPLKLRHPDAQERRHLDCKAYMRTAKWRAIRDKVVKREGGLCQGCLEKPATQVHHLTYDHLGAEFCWELRACCDDCHSRWHAEDE